jgi:hypothetical protein
VHATSERGTRGSSSTSAMVVSTPPYRPPRMRQEPVPNPNYWSLRLAIVFNRTEPQSRPLRPRPRLHVSRARFRHGSAAIAICRRHPRLALVVRSRTPRRWCGPCPGGESGAGSRVVGEIARRRVISAVEPRIIVVGVLSDTSIGEMSFMKFAFPSPAFSTAPRWVYHCMAEERLTPVRRRRDR